MTETESIIKNYRHDNLLDDFSRTKGRDGETYSHVYS